MARYVGDAEADHQAALFSWAAVAVRQYPALRMMFHPANGGHRDPRVARKLVGQGVKPGVFDVILDVARGGFHGLRIELKRPGKHAVTAEQKDWLAAWTEEGYRAVVCVGWEAARQEIVTYLESEQ